MEVDRATRRDWLGGGRGWGGGGGESDSSSRRRRRRRVAQGPLVREEEEGGTTAARRRGRRRAEEVRWERRWIAGAGDGDNTTSARVGEGGDGGRENIYGVEEG